MFGTIYGVDFSGAKLAGRNTWVARVELTEGRHAPPYHRLAELKSLEKLCGTTERAPALAHLVERIAASDEALWALDFPFGLPVAVMAPGARWPDQLDFLRAWGEDAYGAGLECLRRARALGGPNHIRRLTDLEERAPFDSYHYRIIYQTCRNSEPTAAAGTSPPPSRTDTTPSCPCWWFQSAGPRATPAAAGPRRASAARRDW
jgi:hypothetical protein